MKFTKRLTAAAASAVLASSSIPAANFCVSAADHNYMEALAMSLYFLIQMHAAKALRTVH